MSKIFTLDAKEYKNSRHIDPVGAYMSQLSILVQRYHNVSKDEAEAWIKKTFGKGGDLEYNAPEACINLRDINTGDRKETKMPITRLFKSVDDKKGIMSPSLTFFVPPSVKKSKIAEFIDEKVKERGKVKKEMFAARDAGDHELEENRSIIQVALKTGNNAASGAHASKGTPLHNKSTHSVLTSICRSATSYGNANNEKLLGGNRHYWKAGIVISNILSISDNTDFDKFEECINKYKLHIPTAEEALEVVKYSTKRLWHNPYAMERIFKLLKSLKPLERAAFVYIGDLFNIRRYNDSIVRDFVTDMIRHEDVLAVDPAEVEKNIDGDLTAYISLLRQDIIGKYSSAKKLKDVADTSGDNTDYHKYLATCHSVINASEKWRLFIRELLTTKNVPASIAKMPEAVRDIAIVSDTDSTMGSAQEWSEWYCGKSSGQIADNVGDCMIYISAQNLAHLMALMSANIGVDESIIFRYAMKNEFKFGGFALTNKAKHYFSTMTSQEGTIFKEPDLEVKGVALRTSNIPDSIMTKFRKKIKQICTDVEKGNDISGVGLLKEIGDIEREIRDSINSGSCDYFRTGSIRTKEGYTNPDRSVYLSYLLWNEWFGPKYGLSGEPPFTVVKVSVLLNNKVDIRKWINSIEDKALAGRIEDYFKRNPNKTFNNLLIPLLTTGGKLPKEIIQCADIRRTIFSSVEPYYHILEVLNFSFIDKNRSRLVSDFY